MYFFKQAGLATDVTFNFSISLYGVAMIGVVISWFAITYLGRRTIFLSGLKLQFHGAHDYWLHQFRGVDNQGLCLRN
jgi:hypothetical protein